MRLDRLLSNLKYGTRKEVSVLIKTGEVLINGETIFNPAHKLDPNHDIVKIFGETLYYKEEIILAINKPIGYLSANSDNLHPVVTDLLDPPYDRFDFKIAGRLDLDTEGLVIMSTSGKTVHEITNPNKLVNKTYIVETDEEINSKLLERLLEPIPILDGNNKTYLAQALSVELLDGNYAKIVINTGRYHQVKRMFRAIGYEVVSLKRIQIGKYIMPKLDSGEYIEIRKEDIL